MPKRRLVAIRETGPQVSSATVTAVRWRFGAAGAARMPRHAGLRSRQYVRHDDRHGERHDEHQIIHFSYIYIYMYIYILFFLTTIFKTRPEF